MGWLTTRVGGQVMTGDATFGGKFGFGRFAGGGCGGCGDVCGGFDGTAFIFANASASNADMSTPFPCILRAISSTRDASSVCVCAGAGEAVGDCFPFSFSFCFVPVAAAFGCFGAFGAFGWTGFLLSFVESFSVSPSFAVRLPISPSYSGLIPHSSLARLDLLLLVTCPPSSYRTNAWLFSKF